MALIFVNIIVAQIWLIATIFGLLMAISFRQAGRSSSGGGVGDGTPLCGGLLEVLLTTSASTNEGSSEALVSGTRKLF